jgi:uncharacterized iron-regulated protein
MKSSQLTLMLLFLGLVNLVWAQSDLAAYQLYDAKGKSLEFKDLMKQSAKSDVVFFGELHNNPIDHWLQLELTKALMDEGDLVLGAEMFETDDQIVLNEYLQGKIKLEHLKKEAKVWPNYDTDYAPLVEVAKEKGLDFIATNVPRRYASLTSREGRGGLKDLDGAAIFLPELPFEVTKGDRGYSEMMDMMGGHGHGMNMEYLVEAQALKDYTMASSIASALPEKGVFLHFNGSFHSQYRAGIIPYLLAKNPKLDIVVIAAVEADDMTFKPEWAELGDVILVTPTNMTKTH